MERAWQGVSQPPCRIVWNLSLTPDQMSSLDLDLALLVNGVPVSFPYQPDLLCLLCPAALLRAPLVNSQRCASMSICIVPKRLQSNKTWEGVAVAEDPTAWRCLQGSGSGWTDFLLLLDSELRLWGSFRGLLVPRPSRYSACFTM